MKYLKLFENFDDTCQECDGSGEIECYGCDGSGVIGCDCPECGGYGGIDDCEECGGSGESSEDCILCSGIGTIFCENCDGTGAISDDEDDEDNDRIDFGIRNDMHDVPNKNFDLAIELANKVRNEPDDSTATVDEFLAEFGIKEGEMTGFGWGAILKNSQKYNDMSDEEFKKEYDEYKKALRL